MSRRLPRPAGAGASVLAVSVLALLLLDGFGPAAQSEPVIPLWPGAAPGSEGQNAPEVIDTQGHVSSVHHPSITVFAPPANTATGAAVLVCPGGGHRYLAIQHEGYDVARWLNQLGITAFVLKYRLARDVNSPYAVDVHAPADAGRQSALELRLQRLRTACRNRQSIPRSS